MFGLMFAFGASAQSAIDNDDILFWVGHGTDSAIIVINWVDELDNSTTYAWGLAFDDDEGVVVSDALDSLSTYDPRFYYHFRRYMGEIFEIDMVRFVDDSGDTLATVTAGMSAYNCLKVDGLVVDPGDYEMEWINPGSLMEISTDCYFVHGTIVPVSVPSTTPTSDPVDATIAASDILYWVGSGPGSVIMAINWGAPDTCLAWGVHFNGPYITNASALDTIAAYDSRLSYSGIAMLDNISYTDGGDTFQLFDSVGNYWGNNVNGNMSAGINAQLHDGDFSKWGDGHVGIGYNFMDWGGVLYPMGMAWVKPVTPVPVPVTDTTPVPAALCDSVYALPYTEAFSNCTAGQDPCEAGAPLPECWTVLSNGHYTRDVDPEEYIYFSGIGTSTSTDNYGCIAVGDPFFSFIAAEIYNGTDSWYNEDMLNMGTRKYAILPAFERPLSQLAISFDYRTSKAGAALLIGYVVSDTADFVALDSIASDFRVLHHVDSLRLDSLSSSIPDSARLALCWKATATTSSYVGNIYCGIDNFRVMAVASDTTTPDTTSAPVEATIAASDILYWVGEGSNQVVLAVNWADTALAWGYRFSTESVTVATMMADIAAADPRFSYTGSGYISDILYIDTAAGMTDTLRGSSYWESKRNGVTDAGMAQSLVDGDFEKWGTPAAGVVVDSTYWGDDWGWGYTYVYPMAITPVSVPDTATTPDDPVDPDHGPFCGAAGTEGSTAIAADSDLFVAWATGVSIVRGPVDIANHPDSLASYGEPEDAIGPVSPTDNLRVVSLGDGGTATITFDRPIGNGNGPDFAVFENGFDDHFLELAFVEVSSDGQHFVRFPATSLTQTETQATRLDPTYINNLAGKYRMGYGTPFDLEELRDSTGLDINNITHVRLVDVVGSIDPLYATYDAFGHIVNDPWPTFSYSAGFDLAGIGVIHQSTEGIDEAEPIVSSLWPNPTTDIVNVSLKRAAEATLYDATGRQVAVYSLVEGRNTLSLNGLGNGVYMLRVEGMACKIVKK